MARGDGSRDAAGILPVEPEPVEDQRVQPLVAQPAQPPGDRVPGQRPPGVLVGATGERHLEQAGAEVVPHRGEAVDPVPPGGTGTGAQRAVDGCHLVGPAAHRQVEHDAVVQHVPAARCHRHQVELALQRAARRPEQVPQHRRSRGGPGAGVPAEAVAVAAAERAAQLVVALQQQHPMAGAGGAYRGGDAAEPPPTTTTRATAAG